MSDLDVIKQLETQLGYPLKQLKPEEIYDEEKNQFVKEEIERYGNIQGLRAYAIDGQGQVTSLSLDYIPKTIYEHVDISNFKHLENLSFRGGGDFKMLVGLKKLKRVDVSFCRLINFTFLKEIEGLISLDLSENEISDISFLKDFSGLISLNLSYNQISDYSFLKELKGLISLDLSGNEISDYSF